MKSYKLITLWWERDTSGKDVIFEVEVTATDGLVIQQLHDDIVKILQRELPKVSMKIGAELGGEGLHWLYIYGTHEGRGWYYEIMGWIKRWLCEHGWEPFAVSDFTMYFRQEVSE